MTLVQRLQASTSAPILVVFAERMPNAGEYRVHSEVMPQLLPAGEQAAAGAINAYLESMIRKAPTQYLWSYNRYKNP
jgi:KDO2-lipid IV(A) lauroyltransferase